MSDLIMGECVECEIVERSAALKREGEACRERVRAALSSARPLSPSDFEAIAEMEERIRIATRSLWELASGRRAVGGRRGS